MWVPVTAFIVPRCGLCFVKGEKCRLLEVMPLMLAEPFLTAQAKCSMDVLLSYCVIKGTGHKDRGG